MLERVIGTIGMIFIFLIVLMGAAMFMGVMGQWYKVQDQAQFLATSIADSGYESSTIQAEFNDWNAEYCRGEAIDQPGRKQLYRVHAMKPRSLGIPDHCGGRRQYADQPARLSVNTAQPDQGDRQIPVVIPVGDHMGTKGRDICLWLFFTLIMACL